MCGRRPRAHTRRMAVIEVENLHKRYGDRVAVEDVSLRRRGGRDLRDPRPQRRRQDHHRRVDRGAARAGRAARVRVLGRDPRRTAASCARRVGVQLQESRAARPKLTVGEALELYASFYRAPRRHAGAAAELGLLDAPRHAATASSPAASSSGSRSRWRSSATPRSRCSTSSPPGWTRRRGATPGSSIERVRDRGVTIVLVTHFMEEAERLCDRVAVIDAGRVVALDTPAGARSRAPAASSAALPPRGPLDDRLLGACRGHRRDARGHAGAVDRQRRPAPRSPARSPAAASSPRTCAWTRPASRTRSSP